MRKIAVLLSLIVFLALSLAAEESSSLFSIFLKGGLSWAPQTGSIEDYAPGYNSFPLVPAHSNTALGLSVRAKIVGRLGLELGYLATLQKKLSLIDPGDDDELSTSGWNSSCVLVVLTYDLTGSKIKPYVSLGGGTINSNGALNSDPMTKYGYMVDFYRRSTTKNSALLGGSGIKIQLSKGVALRLEMAFLYLLNDKYGLLQVIGGLQLF